MNIVWSLSRNQAIMEQICTACHSTFKYLYMKKEMAIIIAMLQMTIQGVAQTPKDSLIQKDSLCQVPNTNKTDSTNLFLKKYYLSQTNVANKKDNKGNFPRINVLSKDYYREKFSKFNLINIIGSHLSR